MQRIYTMHHYCISVQVVLPNFPMLFTAIGISHGVFKIRAFYPCVDSESVCTWHRERKSYCGEKLVLPLEETPSCFWLEFTARLAFPRECDGESSLALDEHVALNFPGRLSPLECTGSTKVNRKLVAENNAAESNAPQKQREQTELRLQFEKDRVSLGAQMRWRWDPHFFSCVMLVRNFLASGADPNGQWTARTNLIPNSNSR